MEYYLQWEAPNGEVVRFSKADLHAAGIQLMPMPRWINGEAARVQPVALVPAKNADILNDFLTYFAAER
jgi:hypothetical protein